MLTVKTLHRQALKPIDCQRRLEGRNNVASNLGFPAPENGRLFSMLSAKASSSARSTSVRGIGEPLRRSNRCFRRIMVVSIQHTSAEPPVPNRWNAPVKRRGRATVARVPVTPLAKSSATTAVSIGGGPISRRIAAGHRTPLPTGPKHADEGVEHMQAGAGQTTAGRFPSGDNRHPLVMFLGVFRLLLWPFDVEDRPELAAFASVSRNARIDGPEKRRLWPTCQDNPGPRGRRRNMARGVGARQRQRLSRKKSAFAQAAQAITCAGCSEMAASPAGSRGSCHRRVDGHRDRRVKSRFVPRAKTSCAALHVRLDGADDFQPWVVGWRLRPGCGPSGPRPAMGWRGSSAKPTPGDGRRTASITRGAIALPAPSISRSSRAKVQPWMVVSGEMHAASPGFPSMINSVSFNVCAICDCGR